MEHAFRHGILQIERFVEAATGRQTLPAAASRPERVQARTLQRSHDPARMPVRRYSHAASCHALARSRFMAARSCAHEPLSIPHRPLAPLSFSGNQHVVDEVRILGHLKIVRTWPED